MLLSPEQRPYQPHGTAKDIFYAKDRQIVVSGPAGTGKSRAIIEKCYYLCLKYPLLRVLWLRKTRVSLTESALVTFEDHVLPEGSPLMHGAGRENRRSYQFPNGSVIVVAGLDDTNVDKVMSTEWDIIFIQEAIEIDEEVWDKCDMRLRNGRGPYHQLIGDTNPGAPTHWIYHRWKREGSLKVLEADHRDNPRLYDQRKQDWTAEGYEYIEALKRQRGHLKDRYFYGRWVQPEGARWPELDEAVHNYSFKAKFPHGLPQSLRKRLGVDYGQAAPFAALWFAIDHDSNVWAYRERYQPGLTTRRQAKLIQDSTGPSEYIDRVRMDPAMWQKMQDPNQTGPRERYCDGYVEVLRDDPRFGPIEEGFNASRLLNLSNLDDLLDHSNGTPNLYIDKELCPNFWNELSSAIWASKEAKEDIDPNCPDHAITASFYALFGVIYPPDQAAKPLPATQEEVRVLQIQEINEQDVRDFTKATRSIRGNRF